MTLLGAPAASAAAPAASVGGIHRTDSDDREGYRDGYQDGLTGCGSARSSKSEDSREQGYRDGYQAGFDAGPRICND